MDVLSIQSAIKTDSEYELWSSSNIWFREENNSLFFKDNGSKKIVDSKAVIIIIAIDNSLFTYL